MKNYKLITALFALLLCLAFCVSGCSDKGSGGVVLIEKTSTSGNVDYYTVTYVDGTTSTFTITNGKDGQSVNVEELFSKYTQQNPGATYEQFLKEFLTVNSDGNTLAINSALRTSAKVYSEFTVTYRYSPFQTIKQVSLSSGSSVIYKIDDDYTYFITNYHVIYNSSANTESKIARKITCYLYGSEDNPVETERKDSDGYSIYAYGSYAIECEYVGGSINADLAILKAKTSDVMKINPGVQAIRFADSYNVGQTAIAIGNAEDEGISVTEGIVSVDNEFISLAIDGTTRYYRSVRIDTAIYNGNSGGGLFNTRGELIGITNAGDKDDQNVNYAIPVDIVRAAAENITYYADGTAKKIVLGITIGTRNSKYVYNELTGYGRIEEQSYLESVSSGSIASEMGLKAGDVILSFFVNSNEYEVLRYFTIGDILYSVRANDRIAIKYMRGGVEATTDYYTVKTSDVAEIS